MKNRFLKNKNFSKLVNIPKGIILYNQSRERIDFKKLEGFARENFALKLKVRQNFPASKLSIKDFALEFAKCRVKDINNPLSKYTPLPLELENEQNYLKSGKANSTLIYDGIKLLRLFENLIPEDTVAGCPIVLTDRLFGTFGDDKKFHLRSIICSRPSLISISGIIEAPARPKEFYQIKNRLIALGLWEQEQDKVKERFRNSFIDFGDKRITEVLKGLISQALFFYLSNNPFCEDRECRLFNSHWQEDLIYSQIKSGKFCKRHQALVRSIKERSNEATTYGT